MCHSRGALYAGYPMENPLAPVTIMTITPAVRTAIRRTALSIAMSATALLPPASAHASPPGSSQSAIAVFGSILPRHAPGPGRLTAALQACSAPESAYHEIRSLYGAMTEWAQWVEQSRVVCPDVRAGFPTKASIEASFRKSFTEMSSVKRSLDCSTTGEALAEFNADARGLGAAMRNKLAEMQRKASELAVRDPKSCLR